MADDERERSIRNRAEWMVQDGDIPFLLGLLDAAMERERAAIEEAARVAERHVGAAKAARIAKRGYPWLAVVGEERGEDIAAVEIAKAIRRELLQKPEGERPATREDGSGRSDPKA